MPLAPRTAPRNAKKLAPAFVMTVALLIAPQGCGGNVDDGSGSRSSDGTAGRGGGGTTGGGGSTTQAGNGGSSSAGCPQTQPFGGACVGDAICSYPNGSCGPSTSTCVDGRWSSTAVSCNPPPPACPEGAIVEGEACPGGGFGQTVCPRTIGGCDVTYTCQGTWKKTADSCAICPGDEPISGTSCPKQGLVCEYPHQAGSLCEDAATCANGTWSVRVLPCDQPFPTPCDAWATAASCAKDAACRWLEPGCNNDAQWQLPEAGCYPAKDCQSTADCEQPGQKCATVVVDPCAGKGCASCYDKVDVCR